MVRAKRGEGGKERKESEDSPDESDLDDGRKRLKNRGNPPSPIVLDSEGSERGPCCNDVSGVPPVDRGEENES